MKPIMDRKAATDAYKDRATDAGVYAFHAPNDQVWVGATPTLGTLENRIRFSLRGGGHTQTILQKAWNDAAGEGFRFEVLERLDPDLGPLARDVELKSRAKHWRETLGALPL